MNFPRRLVGILLGVVGVGLFTAGCVLALPGLIDGITCLSCGEEDMTSRDVIGLTAAPWSARGRSRLGIDEQPMAVRGRG